jgi:hypothetical protein
MSALTASGRHAINTAYSFLCAHSEYYNCPLVLTNVIDTELNYGEKYPPLVEEEPRLR